LLEILSLHIEFGCGDSLIMSNVCLSVGWDYEWDYCMECIEWW